MSQLVIPDASVLLDDDGLDIRGLVTTGSLFHIKESIEIEDEIPHVNFMGKQLERFEDLEKQMIDIDKDGYVKKSILEGGGGFELNEDYTVHVVYSGFWKNEAEPFDSTPLQRPLVVNLKDNKCLPGFLTAVKSMMVGELSVFLLSYQVMYGEIGVPPRIKPKEDCIFYIKIVKAIITPKEGEIDFGAPNMFRRVKKEVVMLYLSGTHWYKVKNYSTAVALFRRAINMLHKCRLADENEEKKQQKLLAKLYINIAICYNALKLPLKACSACNDLREIINIWNNERALFINAKALRMIGQFGHAEKRLRRAMKLKPGNKEMAQELELILKMREVAANSKAAFESLSCEDNTISKEFKDEVNKVIKEFKENMDLNKMTLPSKLNKAEAEYINEVCKRESMYCTVDDAVSLNKDAEAKAIIPKFLDYDYNDDLADI